MKAMQNYVFRQANVAEILHDTRFQFRDTPNRDLESLVTSLRENGQINPVIAREQAAGGLQLLAGFGRVDALRRLGRKKVDVKVYGKDTSDEEATQIALQDNIERKTLTPWDNVSIARKLRKEGKTNAQIGRLLGGVTVRTIQRYLTVSNASPEYRRALQNSEVTIQQAYEGMSRSLPIQEVKKPGQSVRLLREMSRKGKEGRKTVVSRRTRNGGLDFHVSYRPLESDLDDTISKTSQFLNELIGLRSSRSRSRDTSQGTAM